MGDQYTLAVLRNLMDAATIAGIRSRYGDAWLATVPSVVNHELGRLGLEASGPLAGGRTACVVKVMRGTQAFVLKISPDVGRSRREAEALARFEDAGVGPQVVEVWEASSKTSDYHGMLLELIADGISLRDRPSEAIDTASLADLLAATAQCGAVPLAERLLPVESHIQAGLSRGGGGGLHGAPPASKEVLADAVADLANLQATADGHWIHGTLHPANIVRHQSGKLLAIDPRPFLADRAYDVAELALKLGSERAGRRHNQADGISLLDRLSAHLEFDQARSERWLRVLVASGV